MRADNQRKPLGFQELSGELGVINSLHTDYTPGHFSWCVVDAVLVWFCSKKHQQ